MESLTAGVTHLCYNEPTLKMNREYLVISRIIGKHKNYSILFIHRESGLFLIKGGYIQFA